MLTDWRAVAHVLLHSFDLVQRLQCPSIAFIVNTLSIAVVPDVAMSRDQMICYSKGSRPLLAPYLASAAQATILISLLQPTPETYGLFDDLMLLAEGA